MKFSIKNFPANLLTFVKDVILTFIEEILNGKLHFLYSQANACSPLDCFIHLKFMFIKFVHSEIS